MCVATTSTFSGQNIGSQSCPKGLPFLAQSCCVAAAEVRTDSRTLVGMTHLGFKIPEFPVKLDRFGKPKAISYTVGISVSLSHITLLFS